MSVSVLVSLSDLRRSDTETDTTTGTNTCSGSGSGSGSGSDECDHFPCEAV
jgi:hypothetical protein